MQLSVGQQYGAEGIVLSANKVANMGIEDA